MAGARPPLTAPFRPWPWPWRRWCGGLGLVLILLAAALPPRGVTAADLARDGYLLSGGLLADLCGADQAALGQDCPHCHLPAAALPPPLGAPHRAARARPLSRRPPAAPPAPPRRRAAREARGPPSR